MDNKENIEYWFTVNGNHIPVKKGQTKEQAFDEFLKEKGDMRGYSIEELQHRQRLEDTLSLPDEILPRSLSAKWANYKIQMADGTEAYLLEGSKLHHKQVIAGNGVKRKIDEIDRLVAKYGGNLEKWQKIKAFGTVVCENGEIEEIEIHWYEEPTVGRVKLKEKI